jgi:hypothetical protein
LIDQKKSPLKKGLNVSFRLSPNWFSAYAKAPLFRVFRFPKKCSSELFLPTTPATLDVSNYVTANDSTFFPVCKQNLQPAGGPSFWTGNVVSGGPFSPAAIKRLNTLNLL